MISTNGNITMIRPNILYINILFAKISYYYNIHCIQCIFRITFNLFVLFLFPLELYMTNKYIIYENMIRIEECFKAFCMFNNNFKTAIQVYKENALVGVAVIFLNSLIHLTLDLLNNII